jgi:cytochrome subunit of sulfide dehydrogenase
MRPTGIAVLLLVAAPPAAAQAVAPPGAAACSGCHGAGAAATVVPPLRGLAPDDIVAAMQAFRSGQRPATVMDRIAKGFTDEETRAIAAWVSRQPRGGP